MVFLVYKSLNFSETYILPNLAAMRDNYLLSGRPLKKTLRSVHNE